MMYLLKMDREMDLSEAKLKRMLITGDLFVSFLKGNALLDIWISICR